MHEADGADPPRLRRVLRLHPRPFARPVRRGLLHPACPQDRPKEIDPPRDEFYATDVFNAYALEFIRQGQAGGKPWFLFLGHSSPHFPVQAPAERADKYDATYLRGWDVLRQERFDRMQQIGLIDGEHWKLTPRSLVPVDRDDIANGFPGSRIPRGIARGRSPARSRSADGRLRRDGRDVDHGVGRIVPPSENHGRSRQHADLFPERQRRLLRMGAVRFRRRVAARHHDAARGRGPAQDRRSPARIIPTAAPGRIWATRRFGSTSTSRTKAVSARRASRIGRKGSACRTGGFTSRLTSWTSCPR